MEPDEELKAILSHKGSDISKIPPVSSLPVLPCPISLADRRTPFQSLKQSPIPFCSRDDENFLNIVKYLLIQLRMDPIQIHKIECLLLSKRNYGVILSPENELYLTEITTLIECYVNEISNKHQ